MRKIFLLFIGVLTVGSIFAQSENKADRCGFDFTNEYARSQGVPVDDRISEFNQRVYKYIEESKDLRRKDDVVIIPVHLTVVHLQNEEIGVGRNISLARIQSQLDVLNEDFNKLNEDVTMVPPYFTERVGNIQVEFCLAKVDPDGNPTDGITRYVNNSGIVSQEEIEGIIKPATIWDEERYLNMWSVRLPGTLLGYAYLPNTAPPNNDGVVVTDTYFGRGTGAEGSGRTMTHEVGHYLGLLHIWGPCATGTDCCGSDDGVADTPNQRTNNGGCPAEGSSSCSSPDMFMNYMDYVDDNCMHMFSVGQSERMRATLATFRKGLGESSLSVCSFKLTAEIGINTIEICAGDSVLFTNNSTGNPNLPLNSQWTFTGGLPNASSATEPGYVSYETPGQFLVQLRVSDDSTNSSDAVRINVIDCSNLSVDTIIHVESYELTLYENVSDPPSDSDGGTISGHNGYGDKAKAEFIKIEEVGENDYLIGADYYLGVVEYTNPSAQVQFGVWDNSGLAGSPGELIASKMVRVDQLVEGEYNSVNFDGLIPISDDFYVGVLLDYTNGTTIAIATDEDGATIPATAWEQFIDDSWHPFNDYTATNVTWELDVALAVNPRVGRIIATKKPIADFTSTSIEVCEGSRISFQDKSINLPMEWIWSFGDGADSSISQNPTIVFREAGTFDLTLLVSNNIGSDTIVLEDYITVLPKPLAPTIAIDEENDSIYLTEPAEDLIQWFNNGIALFESNGEFIKVEENGGYYVLLVNDDGCKAISNIINYSVEPSSIETFERLNIEIYPNPMNEVLNIDLSAFSNKQETVFMNLTNVTGKQIINDLELMPSRNTISMEQLSKGIYIITLSSEREVIGSLKLIKR